MLGRGVHISLGPSFTIIHQLSVLRKGREASPETEVKMTLAGSQDRQVQC